MKLLIDESLSSRVAQMLADHGHDALEDLEEDIDAGAIVVLSRDRARIRRHPI